MNRASIFALVFLFPGAATAETVNAISGEHADFSRIVLQFDNLDTWEFGRVAGGYELRTGLSEAEFDLSSVFDKIPKSRISEITSPANGRLFLSVSCQCAADVCGGGDRNAVAYWSALKV